MESTAGFTGDKFKSSKGHCYWEGATQKYDKYYWLEISTHLKNIIYSKQDSSACRGEHKQYWHIWNNHLDSMFFGKNDTVSCWNGEIMTICMAARKKTGIHNKFKPPPWYVVITVGMFFRSSNDQYGFVYLYFEYNYHHCLLPLVVHYYRYDYNVHVYHYYQYK